MRLITGVHRLVVLIHVLMLFTTAVAAEETAKILIIGAKPDHPPATHMYELEGRMLAECVSNHEKAEGEFVSEWPPTEQQLNGASSIVFYSNPAGSVLLRSEYRESFNQLMQAKTGLVAIHWGTGVGYDRISEPKEQRDLFQSWLGGWFRRPPCGIKIGEGKLRMLPKDHPIGRGWKEFRIRDEFYLDPVLHHETKPLLNVEVDGKPQVVGWTLERAGQGRSVGITLGHFHANFVREDFRRLLVNSILWSAHVPVPKRGADVKVEAAMLKLPAKR